MTEARPQRADAIRNRGKIVSAAREQITTHGPDVGMNEIATAAGVAVGTLYRHFPTKADLVTAIVAEYVAQVADDAEAACDRVAGGADATHEITAFLRRVVEVSAINHAAKAAAQTLGADLRVQTDEQRAGAALATLIRAGQADGNVHPDVTVADIYLLFSTAPIDRSPAARERWLMLVLPGLSARTRTVG